MHTVHCTMYIIYTTEVYYILVKMIGHLNINFN